MLNQGCTCDALARANDEIARLTNLRLDEAIADIRERLGEMAWGIGLPSPFVTFMPGDKEPQPLALNEHQAIRILECIFDKLRRDGPPDYVTRYRRERDAAESTLATVREENERLRRALESLLDDDELALHDAATLAIGRNCSTCQNVAKARAALGTRSE